MQKWEYLELMDYGADASGQPQMLVSDGREFTRGHAMTDRTQVHNRLGKEGWELVGFTSSEGGFYVFMFKRPIED